MIDRYEKVFGRPSFDVVSKWIKNVLDDFDIEARLVIIDGKVAIVEISPLGESEVKIYGKAEES